MYAYYACVCISLCVCVRVCVSLYVCVYRCRYFYIWWRKNRTLKHFHLNFWLFGRHESFIVSDRSWTKVLVIAQQVRLSAKPQGHYCLSSLNRNLTHAICLEVLKISSRKLRFWYCPNIFSVSKSTQNLLKY